MNHEPCRKVAIAPGGTATELLVGNGARFITGQMIVMGCGKYFMG